MSGSGGSYLGPDTPSDSCATLRFDTQLASPKAQVIAGLQVGDVLDIAFGQGGKPSSPLFSVELTAASGG